MPAATSPVAITWSKCACVCTILTAAGPPRASAARISGASSPGSITSASRVSGQLTIVQLQPSAPTGNVTAASGIGAGGRRQRRRSGTPLTIITTDGGALGEDLVGDAGDVDEPAVGDAGREEAEADLRGDEDDRRRRAVELVGQRLDLARAGRSRPSCPSRRFAGDSQTVKRSSTTAPWPASVSGSSAAASLVGRLDQLPGGLLVAAVARRAAPSARRRLRCAARRRARAAGPAPTRAGARTPTCPTAVHRRRR